MIDKKTMMEIILSGKTRLDNYQMISLIENGIYEYGDLSLKALNCLCNVEYKIKLLDKIISNKASLDYILKTGLNDSPAGYKRYIAFCSLPELEYLIENINEKQLIYCINFLYEYGFEYKIKSIQIKDPIKKEKIKSIMTMNSFIK